MNSKQKKRSIAIVSLIILLSCAASLILYALKQNINLFYTPSELLHANIHSDQTIRIGGYVKKNSVHYSSTGQSVHFIVTDRTHELNVIYDGVLPNLFREGQVVVVTGQLNNQHFLQATQVLAKHDEQYMPRPVAEALQQGKSS
jgi:cytochrome c-type biogenesis protein CcmE